MAGKRKDLPTERRGREDEIVPEPLDATAQAAFEESFRKRREVYEALVNL